ncbi:hypothetical protein, partial [Chitinivibrio alkaliphilus]|uniref:hypothetical protein n=1 Tax=Chitinivibrio alkaliphilus TaxID=1505232 RepID=UPI000554C592
MAILHKSKVLVLLLFAASFVLAHLPSQTNALLQYGPTGPRGNLRTGFSNRGEWSPDAEYGGDFTINQGDTVQHGEFEGQDLWWWAKFYASGADDEPGQFAPGGGTSPWVLINSASAINDGTVDYQWTGWNNDLENSMSGLDAAIPTWRDGAEGAYAFTHDDIGAMPLDLSVKPAIEMAQDFPEIKQAWGVFVGEMNQREWDYAVEMVMQGHELFNHSMDHSSAADEWHWFRPNTTVPEHDPAIPEAIRGLEVVGTWNVRGEGSDYTDDPQFSPRNTPFDIDWETPYTGTIDPDATTDQGNAQTPLVLGNSSSDWTNDGAWATFYNDFVEIDADVYWTGLKPSTESGAVREIRIIDDRVEKITLEETGHEVYVVYTNGYDPDAPSQEGYLISTDVGWFELPDLINEYPNYYNGYYMETTWDEDAGESIGPGGQVSAVDLGSPGFLARVWVRRGWTADEFDLNIRQAKEAIDENVWSRVENSGEYFRRGRRDAHYGYPFDIYSEVTHDSLYQAGYTTARGGAKSGVPTPGDFFHPFRIDFDAFFITRNDWTVNSAGEEFIYPNNPHVLMGANEMVDSIISQRGYMIRELHAVADIPDGEWYNDDRPEFWPVNTVAAGKGGWWGGITVNQLRRHYEYVQERIDDRRLTVFTPTEAVKYRITANATESATVSRNGDNYTLSTELNRPDLDERYWDEITVIVSLDEPVDSLAVKYHTINEEWCPNGSPRRRPRQMD